MKKCVLILSLLMLTGATFARMHETYIIHQGYDCYNNIFCTPHRIKGHTHYRVYYPQTGVSVNIGKRYRSMSPVTRSIYYPYRRNRSNISVNVSI